MGGTVVPPRREFAQTRAGSYGAGQSGGMYGARVQTVVPEGGLNTNFSFNLMGSRTGGSAVTNFSFREQHESGDGTGGRKTVISGGMAGGGGVYAGLGGRGSGLRLAARAEVQEDLVNWSELQTVTLLDGTAQIRPRMTGDRQFYRAKLLP